MIVRLEIIAPYASRASGILVPGTLLRAGGGTVVEVFRSKARGGDNYTLWVKRR